VARKPSTPEPAGGPSNGPGDKTDNSAELFSREVDEAMREDQLAMFWQNYGLITIAVIVIGLASFGGWLFYQNSLEEASGVKSEEFISALDADTRGNVDGAINALKPLKDADQPGYRALARVGEAGLLSKQGKAEQANKNFAAIAADGDVPQEFRDLALIRQTLAEFDTMEPAKVIERMKPLAVPGAPWFGSAGEMVAIAHLKMEKPDLAGPIFAELAKDKNVPATVRDRASQMAGLLGIDTIDLDEEKNDTEGEEAESAPTE
jgi:hypothetical protein